jgi:hypothetical protein
MKELMNELMNHGYSEHQAQRFLGKCVIEFRKLFQEYPNTEDIAKLLGLEHVEVRKHDNETVGN